MHPSRLLMTRFAMRRTEMRHFKGGHRDVCCHDGAVQQPANEPISNRVASQQAVMHISECAAGLRVAQSIIAADPISWRTPPAAQAPETIGNLVVGEEDRLRSAIARTSPSIHVPPATTAVGCRRSPSLASAPYVLGQGRAVTTPGDHRNLAVEERHIVLQQRQDAREGRRLDNPENDSPQLHGAMKSSSGVGTLARQKCLCRLGRQSAVAGRDRSTIGVQRASEFFAEQFACLCRSLHEPSRTAAIRKSLHGSNFPCWRSGGAAITSAPSGVVMTSSASTLRCTPVRTDVAAS